MNVRPTGVGGGLNHVPLWAFQVGVAGIFVLVVLLTVLRAYRRSRSGLPPAPTQPPATNRGCLIVFGGLFALVGLAALFFITIRPAYRAHVAAGWPTVPGTVISSKLELDRGTKGGNTYRIDIHYRYRVNDRPYESNQYDSRGAKPRTNLVRAGMEEAVRAHPPGSTAVVHYDPADPADAMISTAVPPGTFAFVWFPFVFIGAGTAIMIFSGKMTRAASAAGRPARPTAVSVAPAAADARGKRRRDFIGTLVITVFWNAIVIGVGVATRTWCVIPFALVGVLLLVMLIRTGAQVFNPIVSVAFSRMPLHPGDGCDVTFALSGNYFSVRTLSFALEGREHVSYRQGTNTRTETHVAWRLPLFETTKNYEMEKGRFTITLPPDAMTSFVAANNRFTWHLVCRGDVAWRPDIKDEFDVTVLSKAAR